MIGMCFLIINDHKLDTDFVLLKILKLKCGQSRQISLTEA